MDRSPGAIVLAVYRPDPELLQRQLRSVAEQSFRNWTCVVGLDGPDEAAAALVHDMVGHDERFQVIQFEQNVGIYRHFERLLARVPSHIGWVALCDQDDYWHPTKLERLTETLDRTGSSGAVCQARLTTRDGQVIGRTVRHSTPLVTALLINQVTGCLSIFTSDVLRRALPFPDASRLAIHDHWMGSCAASMNGVQFMDEVLHDYVQHDSNAIGEQSMRTTRKALMDLLTGHISLRDVSEAPWAWRVAMARSLRERAPRHAATLAPIARGRVSVALVSLMFDQVRSRRVPLRVALALILAAVRR